MAESAIEFSPELRIIMLTTKSYFHMKSSNPKVMIQAYRLVVSLMKKEGMDYPLHLGVTEAGDGEDARIKSAIGIGSLLFDGLGDTIRVSLTEDPIAEIPVARDLACRAHLWWEHRGKEPTLTQETDFIDPFSFTRRPVDTIQLGSPHLPWNKNPPTVIAAPQGSLSDSASIIQKKWLERKSLLKMHPLKACWFR